MMTDESSGAGLLASETATTIILRGRQRKGEAILQADIDDLRAPGKSLMPEGLEKGLPRKDMADLLAVRPPAKVFLGNTPAPVKPNAGARLLPPATQAELYGGDIAFEAEFKNVGMWPGPDDRAEWRVELPKAATFDVYLHYAYLDRSAGESRVVVHPARSRKGTLIDLKAVYLVPAGEAPKVPSKD